MANKGIFGSVSGAAKDADTTNEAGGRAFALSSEAALAQIAATGTFNDTYYATAEDQLKAVRELADQCSPQFVAQTAIYARQKGAMKDMPAALTVMLTKADPRLAETVFDRVIDNGKMLRNFVQMIRSGAFGRKCLGSGPKRLVAKWLNKRSAKDLLNASVGQDPSLSQVIALSHPKPADDERRSLYGYLRGFEAKEPGQEIVSKVGDKTVVRYDPAKLPEIVRRFEAFKVGAVEIPDIDFRLLTAQKLTDRQWAEIAKLGTFNQVRQNLNTYFRHGVFALPGMTKTIVAKLSDPAEVKRSRVFPYQLFAAFLNIENGVPSEVRNALQDAVELATENVQSYNVPVVVVVDVSGSMSSAITGHRKGSTSKVRCIDVAGLIGSTILRRNQESVVLPVDTSVHSTRDINSRDSIMTNAVKLAAYGGGGTDLSAALRHLNKEKIKAGLIVIVSDNESWVDSSGYGRSTGTLTEFRAFQKRNPGAKLVCLNIQAHGTTQAPDSGSILNLGGFSDSVFETIGRFVRGATGEATDWVSEIKKIDVSQKISAVSSSNDEEDLI